MNPYKIQGPAVVSFSGGRTSAYMLRKILDAHDDLPSNPTAAGVFALRPDVHVLFANTGKERDETLDFVRDCSVNWGVEITWLEYRANKTFAVVTYETASRNGEPFEILLSEHKTLPNPISRNCTAELKIRTMKRWMVARGYEDWINVVGLRADEPARVAKSKNSHERGDVVCPLATAGLTEPDVLEFWSHQPFDLQLRSYEGNCDLCFLKSASKIYRLIEDHPEKAEWWIAQEQRFKGIGAGSLFRADRPSYRQYLAAVKSQRRLPLLEAPDALPCACTD